MGYCTPDEVRLALDPDSPEPMDHVEDTAAQLSDTQLNDAIAQADSKIDLYLALRYTTPVAPLDPNVAPLTYPNQVRFWSRDLAAYFATLTDNRNMPLDPTHPVYLRMLQVQADLKAVSSGTAVLNLPAAIPSGGGGDTGVAGVINPYDGDLFGPADWGDRPRAGTAGLTWVDGYGW